MQKENTLNEMISICNYFEKNSGKQPLFKPELEAVKKINELLTNALEITKQLAFEVITLYNDVNTLEHYNGSGWYDYKLHLIQFFNNHGIEVSSTKNELSLT